MDIPSPIRRELPGIVHAFDERAMRERLQATLFDPARSSFVVERCEAEKPLFVPGECCTVQYDVLARDPSSGVVLEPVVTGRVFPDRSACAEYMTRKLAPLVEGARGRPDLEMFTALARVIEPPEMLVHAWPIDGEMPTLVDATDPRRMLDVLHAALDGELAVDECRIERVSYRRRQRCVLRYTVSGRSARDGARRERVVYGKLTPYGAQALDGPALEALRDHVGARAGFRFTVPRSLGWRPDLRLALLEAVPGEARMGSALRARLRGEPSSAPLTLEEMIATAARVAAALHRSGLPLGAARTLEDRLADLDREIAITRVFAPEFAERARICVARVAAHARRSTPQAFRLCHGDFKYAQLLFDGAEPGLVDLDRLCQAEPALDLGLFVATLRTQVRKSEKRSADRTGLDDALAGEFLDVHEREMGWDAEEARHARERSRLHEIASLLRVALHSQQKFKDARLDSTTAILEERLAELG